MSLADQSILTSVKKVVGIHEEYEAFDDDIVMHTNTVFSKLYQLGVGSQIRPFQIEDKTATWGQFLEEKQHINMVKTYVCMSVRLIFDPPATSFAIEAIKTELKEMEWRLNVMDDTTHLSRPPFRGGIRG